MYDFPTTRDQFNDLNSLFKCFIAFIWTNFENLNQISVFRILSKMECQVEEKEHFRHLLLYFFNRQENAAEAARNIREVYG